MKCLLNLTLALFLTLAPAAIAQETYTNPVTGTSSTLPEGWEHHNMVSEDGLPVSRFRNVVEGFDLIASAEPTALWPDTTTISGFARDWMDEASGQFALVPPMTNDDETIASGYGWMIPEGHPVRYALFRTDHFWRVMVILPRGHLDDIPAMQAMGIVTAITTTF